MLTEKEGSYIVVKKGKNRFINSSIYFVIK